MLRHFILIQMQIRLKGYQACTYMTAIGPTHELEGTYLATLGGDLHNKLLRRDIRP